MSINTETLITINNLILTNNDRMSGYRQAINLLNDKAIHQDANADLLAFFSTYLSDSRAFSNQLSSLLGNNIYQPEESDGEMVHSWTGTGYFLSADRNEILVTCQKGEEQAAKVYEYALGEETLASETKNILTRQKDEVVRAQKILESLMKRNVLKSAA